MKLTSVIVSFFVLFLSTVSAVYDDEAFNVDWQISTLGTDIEHSVLLGSHYVTLSSEGILSNVNNTSGGALLWRKQLRMNENSEKFLAILSDVILTGINFKDETENSASAVIQLWNLNDSFMIKSFLLENGIYSISSLDSHNALVIDNTFSLWVINYETLTISNKFTDLNNLSSFNPNSVKISILSNGNYFLLLNDDLIILYRGNTHTKMSLKSDMKLEIEKVIKVYSNKIIYVNNAGYINIFILDNINELSTSKSATRLIRTDYKEDSISLIDLNSFVSINNFEFYESSSKDKSLIKHIENVGENLVVALGSDTIQIFDSELGIEQIFFTHGAGIDFNLVSKVLVNYKDKNQLHAVIEFCNGEILSIYNFEILWNKDNSLAYISKLMIYDPSKDISTQIKQNEELDYYFHEEFESSLLEGFTNRWLYHIKLLRSFKPKDFMNLLINLLESLVKPAVLEGSTKLEFGFKKQVIVLTSNNKIFNINSDNGEIIWKFSDFSKYTSESNITYIYNNNNKNVNVAFSNGDIMSINPKTGEVIDVIANLISENEKVVDINLNELAFATYGNHNHTFLLNNDIITINNENKFRYTSFDDDTPEFLNKDFFIVNSDGGDRSLEAIKFNPFRRAVESIWKYSVKSPDERIIATSSVRSQLGSMAAVGIVLGDKRTLYKYIDPNFIAVATFNYKTKNLLILIIDSVSGQIVKTISHSDKEEISIGKNPSDDFQLIIDENYLIYSFYSYHPTASTKIHVVEMYQSSKPDKKSLNGIKSSLTDNLPAPHFESKSFNYPERISKMALTNTKFSIAVKHLVLKLKNGQITTIPKFFVSARRIEGRELTYEEKQEFMAIPYNPNLGIDPNLVISHKRFILSNPKSEFLFSEPTGLESTSIVCYFSTDLFCTKVYPSSRFDTLSSSFNKDILLATVFGLTVVYLYVKSLVEKKRLNSFWVDNV